MNGNGGNAPAWLFAFIDLAFLLLLAMTQLGGRSSLDLGEIIVPRIGEEAAAEVQAGSERLWQLRIHPPAKDTAPFELVGPGLAGVRFVASELHTGLVGLSESVDTRPLLTPHSDSRSQDLLQAVALVEEVWPGRRRAAVERIFPVR